MSIGCCLNIGLDGATGVSFSPLALSPALWLKADAGLYQERTGASATTPASSDADPVGTWQDQSGNAKHLTAPSDATRPALKLAIAPTGLPVVRADGVDDILSVAGLGTGWGSTAGTLVIVMRPNGEDIQAAIEFSSSGAGYWRFDGDGDGYFDTFRNVRLDHLPLAQPTTGTHLFAIRSGATAYEAWRDDVKVIDTTASWGVSANLNLFFQGINFSGIDIAEVLMWNSAISDANLALLTTYLSRWGWAA